MFASESVLRQVTLVVKTVSEVWGFTFITKLFSLVMTYFRNIQFDMKNALLLLESRENALFKCKLTSLSASSSHKLNFFFHNSIKFHLCT